MGTLESRLNYRFRNPALLTEALTHASLIYETKRKVPDNQRLEFLGDAVLQLVLSEALYQRLPVSDEGLMTKMRVRLVSEKALSALARRIGLGPEILMGRAEAAQGGRDRDSTLADAMEAVIGAVFLDSGMEGARAFLLHLVEPDLQAVVERPVDVNPKGQLQELLQGLGTVPPDYKTLSQEGPDHKKEFSVSVSLEGTLLGEGRGLSKKEAEITAARAALDGTPLKELLRTLNEAAARSRATL
jgi:ribonuclease-3